jgi:RNA polymerase sigma factor (sigma-70 family)
MRAIAPRDLTIKPEHAGEGTLGKRLRLAAQFRASNSPLATKHLQEIWLTIWEEEQWWIEQRVASYGFAQTGNRWVDPSDVDDVKRMVMLRATRIFLSFNGQHEGQFKAAIAKAIHWAVVDHVRKDELDKSVPVDPGRFDPGSQQAADGGFIDVGAKDPLDGHIDLMSSLELVAELTDRQREIVMQKASGRPTIEIANDLGLEPNNVDKIFSRAVKELRAKLEKEGQL